MTVHAMFHLQRASAGSGKTYTLAKKYIWYLIAVNINGKWRLRNEAEVADGLPRILAVTFTNKATAEMKQRIIDKLAALAEADGSSGLPDEKLHDTDYLKDFYEELTGEKVDSDFHYESTEVAKRIGITARVALGALLNDYSDFKVSTIDSFFQTVLRTFAYEANLNDSYQVEIDSEYVVNSAVDMTLEGMNSQHGQTAVSFWIGEIVRRKAKEGDKGWNIFQRSDSRQSVYSSLRRAMRNLEKEDFKEIREELDSFFDSDEASRDFILAYKRLKADIEKPLIEAADRAKAASAALSMEFEREALNPKEHGHKNLAGHMAKLLELDVNSTKAPFVPYKLSEGKSLFNAKTKEQPTSGMLMKAQAMYDAYEDFLKLKESEEFIHWKVYSQLLPFLGLIGETRRRILEFLDSNNTIELGETNSMLRRIIGDDDAPFIYERIGTTINHYLIDEFQDTSRLQWENIHPLLSESNGRGEDNLVIGDAKQSIYRFRNADPTLITDDVPASFPEGKFTGNSKEENTNWRSCRRIVEFNNYFFNRLVEDTAGLSQGTVDFRNLYSNVVQYPKKKEGAGFISINILPPLPKEEGNAGGEIEEKGALTETAPLVGSLLERGYQPKEIAVLVESNDQGKAVIESFIKYNSSLSEGEKQIEFISEESLYISSALSVEIVVGVLDQINRLSLAPIDFDPDCVENTGVGNPSENFSFHVLRNPEKNVVGQLAGFGSGSSGHAVASMLADMQSTSLPAIVEATIEKFVPPPLRIEEAVFLAGFQDLVLEYTESYPGDAGLFLQWWRLKGKTRSISSPEGTDAVQVMTIHKSKGLEFECVVVPFATGSLVPKSRSEWRWVRPVDVLAARGLPSFIPVLTQANLKGTAHEHLWKSYSDLYMLDMLNKYYVAFTRAKRELYVFTQQSARQGKDSLTYFLQDICLNAGKYLREISGSRFSGLMLPPECQEVSADGMKITFGKLEENVHGQSECAGIPEEDSGAEVLGEYKVNSAPGVLHYKEGDDEGGAPTVYEGEDADPRSEGTLLHWVMENIETAADIDVAFARLKMRGVVDDSILEEWQRSIKGKISRPEVRRWFTNEWRVMNERPILMSSSGIVRPDRIMVSRDGKSAVIVDYKFGESDADGSHEKQVTDYMAYFSEATGVNDVRGFIWYVFREELKAVK